jgi:hypothetical protein
LAHFNEWTGLIDYGEGKNQFFEGGLVSGINNYAQQEKSRLVNTLTENEDKDDDDETLKAAAADEL